MHGIIHIGAEKTGTTTLQELFFQQRAHLRSQGVLYPRFPGNKQHSLLAFYCMDPQRENHQTRINSHLGAEKRDQWKQRFRSELFQELAAGQASSQHLLISTEMFHSQLTSLREVQRLKSLLDIWCVDYRVIFYMRRQDRLAVSLYSTYLRTGGTRHGILERHAGTIHYYDYEKILELWQAVFGMQQVVPRIFDPDALVEGDLIRDFEVSSRLPNLAGGSPRTTPRNTALSASAQAILREFNRQLVNEAPGLDRATCQKARRLVAGALEQIPGGAPARPSRSEARTFYAPYHEGNCRVAMKWFGRDHLFDGNFDDYPLQADSHPIDPHTLESVLGALSRSAAGPDCGTEPCSRALAHQALHLVERIQGLA